MSRERDPHRDGEASQRGVSWERVFREKGLLALALFAPLARELDRMPASAFRHLLAGL
jgi:hypothetical protein